MEDLIINSLRIVPLSSETAVEALALINCGLSEYFPEFDSSMNPDLQDILSSYTTSERRMLLVLREDEVIATGALIKEEERIGRIVRMSVKKSHRGRGIAQRMVGALEDLARSVNYGLIRIETTQGWNKAIALYRRCGYTITGEDEGSVYFEKKMTREKELVSTNGY